MIWRGRARQASERGVTQRFEVVGELMIPATHPSLPGHFPLQPIVPGAVLLDMICQTASRKLGCPVEKLRLTSVKFMHPVTPNLALKIAFCVTTLELRFNCSDQGQIYLTGHMHYGD